MRLVLRGSVRAVTQPSDLNAVRAAYDTVAVDYAELLRTELAGKPTDRMMLRLFAELVGAGGNAPVADVGCGPGRVTAYLHSCGLTVFGVDLSPAMIAVARQSFPTLEFEVGSMSALDLEDGALGGIVAWYSIIHTPPERLARVFAEFNRVLRPGGYLLLSFQVGDALVHLEHAYGHEVSLDVYRLSPDRVSELLRDSGLVVRTRLEREPDAPERLPQAYLIARRRADAARPDETTAAP